MLFVLVINVTQIVHPKKFREPREPVALLQPGDIQMSTGAVRQVEKSKLALYAARGRHVHVYGHHSQSLSACITPA